MDCRLAQLAEARKNTMITKMNAREYGKRGGSKNTIAQRIAKLKSGKYSKDPEVRALITPTPAEKAIGITKDDKIEVIKNFAPELLSEDAVSFFMRYAYVLTQFKASVALKEKRDGVAPLKWKLAYLKELKEFGILKFKLNSPMVQVQNNTQVKNKVDLHDLMNMIYKLDNTKIIEVDEELVDMPKYS